MKMNYLSGDNKKSILGKRLSSRYLSSDAFTSSAGKTSGRSISQLGSLFGRKTGNRKFSGTGQRIGLFEFKNMFLKFVFVITCVIVIGYTVPFTRYAMHRFFVMHTVPFGYLLGLDSAKRSVNTLDALESGEYYVSPAFGKTDRFTIDIAREMLTDDMQGEVVYDTPSRGALLGALQFGTSSKAHISLLSEVGQKNNLFIKNADTSVQQAVSNAEETSSTTSTTTDVKNDTTEFSSAIFEGFGYGQLRAQIPPQQQIEIGTILYARTKHGLVQAARVSFIEKDTGSTFTNIYAQLLVPPFSVYKVYIEDTK